MTADEYEREYLAKGTRPAASRDFAEMRVILDELRTAQEARGYRFDSDGRPIKQEPFRLIQGGRDDG